MDNIAIIILALVFSAFFSGMEIAFISSNKLRLELVRRKGWLAGRSLSYFIRKPSEFIGATLVGNNIVLVIYSIATAALLEKPLEQWLPPSLRSPMYLIILQTFIATFIVFIAGEFLPKLLFRIRPVRTLVLFALPFMALYYLLYPVVFITLAVSKLLLGIFSRSRFLEKPPVFSKPDLVHLFREGDKRILEEEGNINSKHFERALHLRDVKVRACMVPRTEIVAIDAGSTVKELKELIVSSKHSRIIVYARDIDNITGYVHHYALLGNPPDIRSVTLSIPVVPESLTASELLGNFRRERKNIAWVVDEFGGTAGIVTLEDIMEEIFGEIEDEFDREDLVEKQLDPNTYVLSARLEIDYLNDKYSLGLPVGNYETLGGLMISSHEHIPRKGESVTAGRFEFTVTEGTEKRVDIVKLKVREEEKGEE